MQVVVRRHRPLLVALIATLILVALAAGSWTVVRMERERLGQSLRALQLQHGRLAAENRRLFKANEVLTRKVARVGRASQVEAQAYEQVNAHLDELREELQAAREEVSFYQGIMSESGSQGVRIQRFTVEPAQEPGHFLFRLVLTRGLKDDNVLKGSVRIAIDGQIGSKARRLAHKDTVAAGGTAIAFKFRHFQRIENELVLPDRFIPKSVTVQLRSGSSKSPALEESFAWPS